jgi:hypothetical protein
VVRSGEKRTGTSGLPSPEAKLSPMPTTKRSVTVAAVSATWLPPISTLIQAPVGYGTLSCTGVSQGSVTAFLRGPRACPCGEVSQLQSTVCASSRPSSRAKTIWLLGLI